MSEEKDFKYTTGMDIADSVVLIVLCALILLVVFL